MSTNIRVAIKLALRDMRGSLAGFRIFLACLTLGVGAVAAAGSVNEAVRAGMEADAQRLLGGDLELRLGHRNFTDDEIATLSEFGTVDQKIETRTMTARAEDPLSRTLVELKAVTPQTYPLFGDIVLDPPMALSKALAPDEQGLWGAVAEETTLARLNASVGDIVTVGRVSFELRAALVSEPDRLVSAFSFGPRLMVSNEALAQTMLVQTGSMVRRYAAVRVNDGVDPAAVSAAMDAQFPDAAFRVRGLSDAAEGLDGFLDNITLFLTLVGLSALLVGGIGISGAVRAHVDSRVGSIAALKCLGASEGTIRSMFALQIAVLAGIGIVVGVGAGATAPTALNIFAADLLPTRAQGGFYVASVIQAALFGGLTTALFAAVPLAGLRSVRARALFDGLPAGVIARLTGADRIVVVGLTLTLGTLVVITAAQPVFAAWFLGGTAAAFVLFLGAVKLIQVIGRRLSRPGLALTRHRPSLRLALAALHRPGSATASVVLSLGLGLTVLVATALIEVNLSDQVAERLPDRAPAFFFIDVPDTRIDEFKDMVLAVPGVTDVRAAFMIRGPVRAIKGVPVAQAQVAPDAQWVTRGDRGFSKSADPPRETMLVKGEWWDADHSGKPLVSMTEDVARGLGMGIGDTITVNILGRDITAEVANIRSVNWRSGQMNFTFVFSPNALAGAPGNYLVTVEAARAAEVPLARAVAQQMPEVTAVRVREALEAAGEIISGAGAAVRVAAALALASGVLVLGGAMAAGSARRRYESVVLKVIGASRADITRAFALEYGLMGAVAGTVAAVVGGVAAWGVVSGVMDLSWRFSPTVAIGVVVGGVALTLLAGFAGTWRALGVRAAPYLREA